ncbi:hypothetical protein HMPREF9120_00791 [Neisseria sp. oral taxon 020 str. F0370]|nr:hypothetical protein HMPREF9120_00791 [Neisseria sp. oral taxon 020 str. F0370]
MELIFEHNKKTKDKAVWVEDIRRIIRASVSSRAKEGLIVDFINETDLDAMADAPAVIEAFYQYARQVQQQEAAELITSEGLNEAEAKRYLAVSLKREYASENGTDLNDVLPKMSPLNPQYRTKKQNVFEKIAAFVEKFKGVGGSLDKE